MSDLNSNGTQIWLPSVQVVTASDLPSLWSFKYLYSNAGLPLLACSIFLAFSFIHLSMLVISKRFYMLPLTLGLLIQSLGQIFKIISVASNSTSVALNFYALYSLTIASVPFLFLTSVVWMIRHMMKTSNHIFFPFIVRMASHQIISLEAVAFWLQAYGLLVRVNPLLSDFWSAGNLMTLIGSAIEFFNFSWVWLSLSIILWKQSSRSATNCQNYCSFNFWGLATVITISVTLVMVRTTSIFVFHLKSPELEPFRNELLTFLLQSLPIALCAAFLIAFHPCRYDASNTSDEELSFFVPDKATLAPLGSEAAESICPSLNRASNGSDPFSAVPLKIECLPKIQLNSTMRSFDQIYLQSNKLSSHSISFKCHQNTVCHSEKNGEDWENSIYHENNATGDDKPPNSPISQDQSSVASYYHEDSKN